MRVSPLYRIAAVLLMLFAIGHTLGFRRADPRWGVDAVVGSMRATRFEVQGFSRTYWDFYTSVVACCLVLAAWLTSRA